VLGPQGNPSLIRIKYQGITGITNGKDGSLVVTTSSGKFTELAPDAYQMIGGQEKPVSVSYNILSPTEVGFNVGTYDRSQPLVIDPVMQYGIYLAGIGVADARAITKDSDGDVYVAGKTYTGFSLSGTDDEPEVTGSDAVVVKINPDGSAPLYITYLGGSGEDGAAGITIDENRNVFVTGSTSSTDFPTFLPLQGSLRGTTNAFVLKLGPSGDTIIYSTYLGGDNIDNGNAIAIDPQGNAYITGTTTSVNFPTINEFHTYNLNGAQAAFVSKIDSTGSSLVYSGYLDGNSPTTGAGIAVDNAGNAFVTGETYALAEFPIVNAFQSQSGGNADVYLTKIAPNGGSTIYSTYIGGSGYDSGASIAIDSAGNAYITGTTDSPNFPIKNAPQQNPSGALDAFILKMSPDGNHLVYSTYLGGGLTDRGTGIALNEDGDAYICGWTISPNLPVVNPYQLNWRGASDAFVAKLDSSGSLFDYVTYLGGNGRDPAYAIAADNNGNAYIAGNTSSTNFPMVNPYPLPPGILGGYVVHLGDQPVPPEPPVVAFSANNTIGFKPLTIQFTDQSTGHPNSWAWNFGDGSTSAAQNPVHTYTKAGSIR
jgi:PKD repeat protein